MTRTLISAGALALAMGLAGPAMAQTLTINGAVVPADQIEGVQAKCDELLAANSAVAIAKPEAKAPAAEAPAAGANASTAATESAAETPVDATVTAEASPAQGNMAADANTSVGGSAAQPIDLEMLTAELCTEGGFTASAN